MGKPPIFITGRFRAGTSFLWQLFDRLPDFCAWYEPLHPQLPSHVKYIKPKADHVGIKDYWRSYSLHPEYVDGFNSDFAHNGLWLESDSQYPELKQYIDGLIELSGGQQAVLQFNRVDFRLKWLRANYPDAIIIHIKRKPMQLWYSQRKHLPESERNNPSAPDAYELMQWSVALSSRFPFLAKRNHPHAFYRSYILHKLSDLMGAQCADLCLSLEQDVFESDKFAAKLEKHVGLTSDVWLKAQGQKHVPPLMGMDVNEMSKLTKIMAGVDALLSQSGLKPHCGQLTLEQIKSEFSEFWDSQSLDVEWQNEEMLHAMAVQQTELTNLMAIKNDLAEQLQQLKHSQHNN
ncbi:sulfotransferase [Marinicella rhabdoformis]|uniref:sulfotransferase n=1 Tax=Marinicella rhabdoformis TaxID=2580566 RepID=UPI0012AEDA0F|nr:sulfotransferase [Marinicella rhabdoformis]